VARRSKTRLSCFRPFLHHSKGLPLLRASPLCTCHRHYPGAASGCSLRSPQPFQAPPYGCTGRPAYCSLRRSVSILARYGLHTRQVTERDPLHRRLHQISLHGPEGQSARGRFRPTTDSPAHRRQPATVFLLNRRPNRKNGDGPIHAPALHPTLRKTKLNSSPVFLGASVHDQFLRRSEEPSRLDSQGPQTSRSGFPDTLP
jgi:hypothetical protein